MTQGPQLKVEKRVGYLESVVDMNQRSPKKNPESDQSGIWTRNIRMQNQHRDHWATLSHDSVHLYVYVR